MDKHKILLNYLKMIQELYSSITSLINHKGVDELSLGTATMYLNSIYEHIDSSTTLLEKGFFESAGAVVSTLWERSVTLQYLLTDSKNLAKVHSEHNRAKDSPWRIKKMLRKLIDVEKLPANADKNLHVELFYFEYTYLCVIKHGNPLTLSYLQRLEKNKEKKPTIGYRPNDSDEDIDLKNLLFLRIICSSFDALKSFATNFCVPESLKTLNTIGTQLTKLTAVINLKVPPIMFPAREEFSEQFWHFLEELYKK